MRKLLTKLSISFAALLFFITTANVIVDLAGVAPAPVPPMQIWGAGEDLGFGAPGAPFRFNSAWFWEPNPGGNYNEEPINLDGYRGRIFTKEKTAKIRIATFGDSSTMGYGIKELNTWSRRLEEELKSRGHDVEVINFGCVGFTIFQGFELYKGRATNYNPDIVCIAFGAINEHFQPAENINDFQKAKILSSAKYQIYTWLSRFRLFRSAEKALGLRDKLQKATTAARNEVRENRPNMRVTPAEMGSILEAWSAQVASEGRKMIFINPPRTEGCEKNLPIILQFTTTLSNASKKLQIPIANVYSLFREHERLVRGTADWFIDTVHPTPEGHRAYAKRVADTIEESGYLK